MWHRRPVPCVLLLSRLSKLFGLAPGGLGKLISLGKLGSFGVGAVHGLQKNADHIGDRGACAHVDFAPAHLLQRHLHQLFQVRRRIQRFGEHISRQPEGALRLLTAHRTAVAASHRPLFLQQRIMKKAILTVALPISLAVGSERPVLERFAENAVTPKAWSELYINRR